MGDAGKLNQHQLHAASRQGDTALVAKLLAKTADPGACDDRTGSSPLHTAAYYGHEEVVSLLLNDAFRSEMCKNKMGETALDVARERLQFCPSNPEAMFP